MCSSRMAMGTLQPQPMRMQKTSPVNTSFRTLKVSMMGVVMPDMVPIMLPSPRFISIKKNMTDQNGEAGKWVMASVKAMKARPVPCTDYSWGQEKDEETCQAVCLGALLSHSTTH